MIPLVLIQNIPGVLQFFTLVVRWLQILRNKRISNEVFIDLNQFMGTFLQLTMLWLNLIMLIRRWIHIRRRKRYLLKPHLLIPLLGGYRFEIKINHGI